MSTEPVPVSCKYYRLLNVGEQLRLGDDFYGSYSKKWSPVLDPYEGQLVSLASPPCRRQLPEIPRILAALGPFVEHANATNPGHDEDEFTRHRVASVRWPDLKRARALYESLTSTNEIKKEKI